MKKRKPLMDSVKDDYSSSEEMTNPISTTTMICFPRMLERRQRAAMPTQMPVVPAFPKQTREIRLGIKARIAVLRQRRKLPPVCGRAIVKFYSTKLQKLDMTEDEWLAKKKEIKYLRERIRKAKKAADAKEAQKQRKGKDAVRILFVVLLFVYVYTLTHYHV